MTKELKERNKGITLIALVITIIVLLILAGVSINMLTGENSTLTKSKTAKEETIITSEKEQIGLVWNALMTINLGDSSLITNNNFEEELNKNGNNIDVEYEDSDKQNYEKNFLVTFNETEHTYLVERNCKITLVDYINKSVIEIDSIEKLILFRDEINQSGIDYEGIEIKLTKDLDFGENNNINWEPIGSSVSQFNGIFNGQNHNIRNLYINATSNNQGLFGVVGTSGEVKNLKLFGNVKNTAISSGRNCWC